MVSLLHNAISGAFFGAALTAAGIYIPSTIIQQMNLTSFHMLKAFLAASGSSALAILISNSISHTKSSPKYPTPIKIPLGDYSGNIVGGAILGIGMTLSGACPGTLWPQLATGIPSAQYVFLGTVLGGILYSFIKPIIEPKTQTSANTKKSSYNKPTLDLRLKIDKTTGVFLYAAACAAGVYAADMYFPYDTRSLLPSWQGGLAVGASQLTSVLLTHSTLGSSAVFEQIGDIFWWLLNPRKLKPEMTGIGFVAGTFVGSYVLCSYGWKYGYVVPSTWGSVKVGMAEAIVGGVCLAVGSRIAGGCTSGHGVSGMSMLSISSFVTVAAIFGGGIGCATVLRYRVCRGVMVMGMCIRVPGI